MGSENVFMETVILHEVFSCFYLTRFLCVAYTENEICTVVYFVETRA